MPITSVQVFFGRPRPPVELKFWTSANHRYVLHGRAIWVSGCGLPLPDRQAASSSGEDCHYQIVKLHPFQERQWNIIPLDHIRVQATRGSDPHCDVTSDAKTWNTSRWSWSQTWDTCLYFAAFKPSEVRIGTEHGISMSHDVSHDNIHIITCML